MILLKHSSCHQPQMTPLQTVSVINSYCLYQNHPVVSQGLPQWGVYSSENWYLIISSPLLFCLQCINKCFKITPECYWQWNKVSLLFIFLAFFRNAFFPPLLVLQALFLFTITYLSAALNFSKMSSRTHRLSLFFQSKRRVLFALGSDIMNVENNYIKDKGWTAESGWP